MYGNRKMSLFMKHRKIEALIACMKYIIQMNKNIMPILGTCSQVNNHSATVIFDNDKM